MDKGKGRALEHSRPSLPTPESGGSGGNDARGHKRKRAPAQTEAGADEDEDEVDDEENIEAKFNKFFDPNQDAEERRDLKKRSRALERGFAGTVGMTPRKFSTIAKSCAQKPATIY